MPDNLDAFVSVCVDAYRAENEITERLTGRAEKYIAAIGVIAAFHVVELPPLKFEGVMWEVASSYLLVAGMFLLSLAFVLTIHSLWLRDSATFATTADLRKLSDPTTTAELAKRSIGLMYLDIRDQILETNQRRARGIVVAGYLLFAGFGLGLVGQIIVRLH